jgi:hypothetical protein
MFRKSKATSELPLTDDQYREKVSKNATAILNSLFASITTNISELKTLNILVIGAGMFPSFIPLILALQRISPNLEKVIFTIVEPLKSATDRFHDFISKLDISSFNIKCEYSIDNMDIKEYLTNINNKYFDIIYFEQPDLSPIGILLAKTGSQKATLDLSLRESIPFLKKVVRPKTIIVASFLFKRDLKQLQILIDYSLNIPTKLVYLSTFKANVSSYSSGLISLIDSPKLPKESPYKIVRAIIKQDSYYAWFVLISMLICIITPASGKLFSFLCAATLLIYHRYGLRSFIVKATIILIQLGILLMELYMTSLRNIS